jgi:preprotein translocase subunit YajC
MGGTAVIIWVLVFFGIFYFIAIRPQRRQQQMHRQMLAMLKRGDEVVTIGGMFGKVTRIGDDWVELEVAKRTRVRYLKRAISQIVNAEEIEEEEDEYVEEEYAEEYPGEEGGEDDAGEDEVEAGEEEEAASAELEAGDAQEAGGEEPAGGAKV